MIQPSKLQKSSHYTFFLLTSTKVTKYFLQMEKNASSQYFLFIHQTKQRHITDDNSLLNGAIDHYYSLKSQSSTSNFISCLGKHYTLFRCFREIARSFSYLSVRLFLYPTAGKNFAPKGRIFMKFCT
jgi:hypothetical protein